MRNGSAGSCPPRLVAFSRRPSSTSAREAASSPSRTTSPRRLVKVRNSLTIAFSPLLLPHLLGGLRPSLDDGHDARDSIVLVVDQVAAPGDRHVVDLLVQERVLLGAQITAGHALALHEAL